MLAFMIRTKMILVPCLWITTITASSSISLKLHSMTFVISLFEAVFAYDARWVLFTVQTSPSDISIINLLGTNPHRHILIHLVQNNTILHGITSSIQLKQAVLKVFSQAFEYILLRLFLFH